jgi:hypothetical protein
MGGWHKLDTDDSDNLLRTPFKHVREYDMKTNKWKMLHNMATYHANMGSAMFNG